MKAQTNFITVTLIAVFLTCASLTSLAETPQNITEAEWAMLPRYCPDTLAFKGYGANRAKWEAVMGHGFSHMHHYCWARITFSRSQRATISREQKNALLTATLVDLQYVVRNTDDTFILLPEVLTWLGRTYLLLRNPTEASQAFAKARTLKPDYWPAYTHWAEFLQSAGKRDEAMAIVKIGLQHAPAAKVLHELFRALGGKPGDIPPHIVKQEEPSSTESPNPDQSKHPPASPLEEQGKN